MDHPIEAQWELQQEYTKQSLESETIIIIIRDIDGTKINVVKWDERINKFGIKAKDKNVKNWLHHYNTIEELIKDRSSDPFVKMIIDTVHCKVLYSAM